jgi:hypothetical protein
MPRITSRSWTAEQINLLFALVGRGVSPARASVVLKRPRLAVQHKARALGRPFADSRQLGTMRLTKEYQARKAVEQSTDVPKVDRAQSTGSQPGVGHAFYEEPQQK